MPGIKDPVCARKRRNGCVAVTTCSFKKMMVQYAPTYASTYEISLFDQLPLLELQSRYLREVGEIMAYGAKGHDCVFLLSQHMNFVVCSDFLESQ